MINVKSNEGVSEISAHSSETLLQALRRAGFIIEAPCGGNGTCGQCKVKADGEEVLACRTECAGVKMVEIPEDSAEGEVRVDVISIAPHSQTDAGGIAGLGLAVDIGTTTVAAYLYDLQTGRCLDSMGAMNEQRSFGADVISRISHAKTRAGIDEMCLAIRRQITQMADAMCSAQNKSPGQIQYISIAGNTVMEHLFAGLDPTGIGVAPFIPESLFGEEFPASEFFDWAAKDCRVYLCPCVAGYVGGDITAGLVSSGAVHEHQKVLFIDIGTNGEMAVGNKDGFICCATAAGPAFEGAQIECGSPARDGAINKVEEDLSFTVIGDTDPASVCGSGLIDAVAAFLKNGIIDETGFMEDEEYHFSDEVYLSGQDIRQVQLAKAAIRAGAQTLLIKRDMSYDDIGKVIIAGGFGAFMRIKSACAIGLLPPALMEKIIYAGNTAGKGAAMALTEQGRAQIERLHSLCEYEELSSSQEFNSCYIEAMMFDEWEEVLND